MPRDCTVCSSSHRRAVDNALARGQSAASIGRTYHLGERSIQRHRVAHVSPAIATVMAKREERSGERIVDRLEALVAKVAALVDRAEVEGSSSLMLAASREVRAGLELLARLTGELDERPTTQVVNVLASPAVQTLTTSLLRALAPYPDARVAAADALDAVGVEVAS